MKIENINPKDLVGGLQNLAESRGNLAGVPPANGKPTAPWSLGTMLQQENEIIYLKDHLKGAAKHIKLLQDELSGGTMRASVKGAAWGFVLGALLVLSVGVAYGDDGILCPFGCPAKVPNECFDQLRTPECQGQIDLGNDREELGSFNYPQSITSIGSFWHSAEDEILKLWQQGNQQRRLLEANAVTIKRLRRQNRRLKFKLEIQTTLRGKAGARS